MYIFTRKKEKQIKCKIMMKKKTFKFNKWREVRKLFQSRNKIGKQRTMLKKFEKKNIFLNIYF